MKIRQIFTFYNISINTKSLKKQTDIPASVGTPTPIVICK